MSANHKNVGDDPTLAIMIPDMVLSANDQHDNLHYTFKVLMPSDFCFWYSRDDFKGDRPKVTLLQLLEAGKNRYLQRGDDPVDVYQLPSGQIDCTIVIKCWNAVAIQTMLTTFNDFFDAKPLLDLCQKHLHKVYNTLDRLHEQVNGHAISESQDMPPALPNVSDSEAERAQFPGGSNESKMHINESKYADEKEPRRPRGSLFESKCRESKHSESKHGVVYSTDTAAYMGK
jgi:hypothetical protein